MIYFYFFFIIFFPHHSIILIRLYFRLILKRAVDADDNREGSHTDNDASDPWINTVTSIESIVARSGLPSDRDDDRKDRKDKMEQQQQQSRSPPSSAAPAKSPMNGNSVQVAASSLSLIHI